MNRDPSNFDCTRDPIYLLQWAKRNWTQMPRGFRFDGESLVVDDVSELDTWVYPFIEWEDDDHTAGYMPINEDVYAEASEQLNDAGYELIVTEWRTEGVFLTRAEAEAWAKARSYRWPKWRVYCVPCEGRLAEILNTVEEPV